MKHKFPRIAHCPWSENVSSDDKLHPNMSVFEGHQIIGTIKMDGECTTLAPNYIHARSLEYPPHKSRTWIKQFWNIVKNDLPQGYQFSGENLFAKHSIHYHYLKSFFYVFMIWNDKDIVISWEETQQWCALLNLTLVPIFYHGLFDRYRIHTAYDEYCRTSKDPVEGYVIRLPNEISFNEIDINKCFKSISKWVRKDHVTTNEHWMSLPVIPNDLEKT
jgi:hypothetical protein